MKEKITKEELIAYLNEHLNIYRCPFCKVANWALISKEEDETYRYFYGFANYKINNQNQSTLMAPNIPYVFSILICKNCGYIAPIDERIIINNINQKKQELKGKENE